MADRGTAVLRDAARRLGRHWPALVALAAAGLLARELLLGLAVAAGRVTAVTGLLVLALVPMASLVVTVAMLLVMRPSDRSSRRRARAVLAALASVIVPFLVVYEHYGSLEQDQREYYYESSRDSFDVAVAAGVDAASRVPQGASIAVLGTVLGALAVRSIAGRLAERDDRWRSEHDARRTTLRVLAGYCDAVWIVLGVFVITLATAWAAGWLGERVVADRLGRWWDDLAARVAILGELDTYLEPVGGFLVGGLLVGIVVPISWLVFGAIVYGVQPADAVGLAADGSSRTGRVVQRVTERVGAGVVDRAWQFSVDSGRRFGPLVGGLAMIRRAGWGWALVFCLAYTVVSQAGYLVWGLARAVAGPAPVASWVALATPLEALTSIVVQVLSAALLAAAADTLVGQLGTTPPPPADHVGRGSVAKLA